MSNSNSPKKLGLSIFLGSIALIGVVVSAALMQNPGRLLNANGVYGDTSDYTVVLDSSNKYTSGTTKEVTTSSGQWAISFEYTNASALSNGHVTLADGGKLVNTREFISLDYLKIHCDGAGTLRFRTSYDGATWGGYAIVSDNEIYNLASNPYYIELTATGGSVNIYQATYQYTCVPNANAEGTEVSTEDEWVRVDTASDLQSGDEVVLAASFGTNWFSLQNEPISETRYYWLQTASITLSNSNLNADVTSDNSVWTIANGTTSGTWKLQSAGKYLKAEVKTSGTTTNYNLDLTETYDSSSCDWTLSFSSSSVQFVCNGVNLYLKRYTQDSAYAYEFAGKSNADTYTKYLYKKVAGESHTEYPTPIDEVGFTVSDSNATGVYTTNSVYSSDNGLIAKAKFSDGSQSTLTSTQYTYTVSKTQGGSPIDVSQAFGDVGTYYVSVSYKDYLPQIIQIHVSEPAAVLTHIDVNSSTLTFNTAQKLSDYTNGITVDLTYDKSSADQTGVAYSELSSYNLSFYLLTPAGVSYDVSTVFGTAGTWTLKVVSNADSSVFGTLEITVNAIPVETISLSASSTSIEEGSTVQLVTSVNPSTATNQELTWTSSDEGVATVNNSGLVTAVSVGEAIITATAQDGSNVAGSITITVTEKITGQDEGAFTLSTGSLTVGSYVIFANQVTDGSGYAMGEQKTNNRAGVAAEFSSGTIERDSTSSYRAFLVKEGTTSGTYAFYDETDEGYLYAASSSSNYLRTETTLSDNSSFAVTGETEKQIVAQGSNSRNTLQYNGNSTNKLFSCYTSGQTAPYIYEKAGDPVYPESISVSGTSSIGVGETSQLSVSYTPTNTTVKSVTYVSSDDTVASVSSTGLVTGIKAGTATITVTGHGNVRDTITITVSNIAVSSVSLNKSTASLTVDGSTTLEATILPSNATNKNVTWTTSDNSVATVDEGVVTAVGAGTATITVKTEDGNKTASCTVTVTASGGSGSTDDVFTISPSDFETSYANSNGSHTVTGSNSESLSFTSNQVCKQSTEIQFQKTTGYIYSTTSLTLKTITINTISQGTFTVYGGTSESPTSEVSGTDGVYDMSGCSYFKITSESSGYAAKCAGITVETGVTVPTSPTSISINPSSAELAPGASKTLSVVYTPSNANQNKAVTWSSNNESVATVDTSGKVTVKSTATVGQTATITARLTNITTIYTTCTITVVEASKDDSTVLIYICGADLESGSYRLASGDITEMLSVSGQPDDVNVVIETGGAKSWASTHGISSSNLQRHHIADKKLVTDDSLTYASMGLTSTLQSFIEYGLTNYPAERTSLILWNHGGGMRGVCYDEKKSDDALKNSEVHTAVGNALSNAGMSGQKLEWIGYDACLMAVQDIAETNSDYFNYMISSEESEAGEGWDYDTWFDDLYAKKDTTVTLKAIVDGFISDNGGASSSSSDQTLSYLDLSYVAAYKSAWEEMAQQLSSVVTSSNATSFNTAITGNVKHFGDTDYDYFCTFDAWDFVDKLASNSAFSSFRIDSSYTTAVKTAFANLVKYSVAQKGAGVAKGLCMYWPNSTQYSDVSTYYTTAETRFTNWRTLCVNRGQHT